MGFDSGFRSIWIINSDGSALKEMIPKSSPDSWAPAVSPDGRYLFFFRYSGQTYLYRMSTDGGEPTQMALVGTRINYTIELSQPSFSPDGKWVFYVSYGLGKDGIWKIPIEGGEPEQVSSKPAYQPIVSPDGKYIASF